MTKVAVVISGCGFLDGAEIYESVFTLLELDRHNAQVKIFAPNLKQTRVVDHLTNQEMSQERNVLVESARIARSKIQPLDQLNVKEFDALILPGGYGAAINLSDVASKNASAHVIDSLKATIHEFNTTSKPIGAMCIAPALLAIAFKNTTQIKITLGDSNPLISQAGALEETCKAEDVVVDATNKIVTTPAFMLNASLTKIHLGISKLVSKVLEMSKHS
ncbi:isoprenoid biosynthesis protein [Candidatus Phycorickettsia trachydisci]|uniref:Isoprenoid biosynthesis protein n=1 Tax=Candidatus Phycorickettsia trachydisci TaxID=2115978 RepID=A0A2P1P9A0_9RICK|nr:isoprenoid biosynthesis glyoxalase ElbB [Candidatus Phycorickettsia trachydisci]AVP87841.1 isoprenoid biosynthesis protein [Candidatus Phycorickettsia trachydisci]